MDFIMQSSTQARVLMITFGKVVNDEIFLAAFAAVRDFVSRHVPCHGIVDFSAVERFEMSNEMLNQLGWMPPAFPEPMRRVVVAPMPAAYVGARIVQALRSASSATLEIVTTTEEALQLLQANDAAWVEV